MKGSRCSILVAIGMAGFALAAGIARAADVPGSVLKLRTSCAGESGPCLTKLADVLAEVHSPAGLIPLPGAGNRVVVDIGPGVFDLDSTAFPYCSNLTNLSYKGAGKVATTLTGGGFSAIDGYSNIFAPYAVRIESCSKLEFQDLTIANEPGIRSGVIFEGDGGTHWSNTRIQLDTAYGWGWVDVGSSAQGSSLHYWFSAEIDVRQTGSTASALYANGGSHRIYGSKFVVEATAASGGVTYGALYLDGAFDVRVHGSRIAALNQKPGTNTWAIYSGSFSSPCPGARLTVEGSEIEAVGVAGGTTSQAVFTSCATSHPMEMRIQGSWFRVSGSANRIRVSDPRVDSPYSLGAGANPPAVSTTWSVKGLDTFVETDCSASRCTSTSQGGESHLLTFDPGCATAGADHGPWYDTSAKKCRGI